MDPLLFDDMLGTLLARLVLGAGVSVLVVVLIVDWALRALKIREDGPDD